MYVPSVSREFASAVFDYLGELGHTPEAVRRAAGLSSIPPLPEGRVSLLNYRALFEAGVALTGDQCFGMNMGARPFPRSWGLVSHLAVAAPNAFTAVSALMDYSELQLNFLRFRIRERSPGQLGIELQFDDPRAVHRHMVEHLIANIVVLASTQIGYALPPLYLELAHDDERSAEQLAKLLQAKVRTGARAYRIEASPDFLQQPALFGEEDLYRVTLELARNRLMDLRGEDRFLNRVREVVLQQLPGGLPKIRQVAAQLDMSSRTLQRRLGERNLRYQKLLDEVRRELAQQLLENRELRLQEIALYLGFNDQSAFQHAFRRWEGVSPGEYRRNAERLPSKMELL